MKYSVQIKNNPEWDLNSKSFFDFKGEQDLTTFCYRLSLVTQKEIRAEISTGGSGKYYHPSNADDNLYI